MYWKELLGLIATIIAFISYVPYVRDILSGKTKPHIFSWLVFLIITFTGFLGQISDNAGPGAWVTGFTAVVCFLIVTLSLVKSKGKLNIVRLDWVSFAGACIAMILMFFVKQPELSIILVVLTDILGFFPTIRKSFHLPYQETMSTYVLSGIKYLIALFALENFSLITALMPMYLVIINLLFVSMLIIRRRQAERG